MTSDYEIHVQEVLKQVPDADPVKVAEAFARYEKDFLIPPVDAMRSVLRRFQSDKGVVIRSYNSVYQIDGDKHLMHIVTSRNTPVKSIFEGEVVYVKKVVGDMSIMINHGDYYSFYGNLKNVNVTPNQKVKTNQILGYVNTDSEANTYLIFKISYKHQSLSAQQWLNY